MLHSPFLSPVRGFTLFEMVMVMLVAGIFLAAGIGIVRPVMRQKATIETNLKLENISRALDFYATQNFRLPCPAVPDTGAVMPPFGYEAGSGATGAAIPAPGCAGTPEGIVPFKTLGIPVDWVKDAWGDYITYAVSPGFSQDVSDAAATPVLVHRRCRTADWLVARIIYEQGEKVETVKGSGIGPSPALVSKNRRKARFCCSGALLNTAVTTNDLDIRDVNDNPQLRYPRQTAATTPVMIGSPPVATAVTTYDAPDNPFPPPTLDTLPGSVDMLVDANVQVPDDDRPDAPVYILVSHGPDRWGAYAGTGVGNRVSTATATDKEKKNADGDRIFYEIPPVDRTTGNAEMDFDDIVLWRSQGMAFASQGESCSLP